MSFSYTKTPESGLGVEPSIGDTIKHEITLVSGTINSSSVSINGVTGNLTAQTTYDGKEVRMHGSMDGTGAKIFVRFTNVTTGLQINSIWGASDPHGGTFSNPITWFLNARWNSTKPSTPSYFEELHKLDNFSKAQYFPRKLPTGLI